MVSTPVEELRSAAVLLRQRATDATPGPWWFDEDDMCWRLHGVAGRIPGDDLIPEQVINSQILKAPKRGTSMAEYWPNAADGAWIVTMNPLVGLALADLLDQHAGIWTVLAGPDLPDPPDDDPLHRLARLILGGGS